jgi:hypothetical protein
MFDLFRGATPSVLSARLLRWWLVIFLCFGGRWIHAEGDSVVVLNEIHYNPANPALEFVELHNPLSVNVDLSGWRFDGGVTFPFPEGTVIVARGYLVVAANPTALQAATGFAGALGPFTGTLSNGGETIRLWNNNSALRTRPAGSSADPSELWSVDIQGDGNGGAFGQVTPTLMTGPEPVSGLGNVWNAFTIAGHSLTSVNPALSNLKNSLGTTTGVGFSITGTVTGFSYAPGSALTYDYLFLAAGNSASSVTWAITGLNPAKTYSLRAYGSHIRGIRMKADANGNGSLADDTAQTVPAAASYLFTGLRPDAAGKIIGNADTPGGEVNWSGFQVYAEQPPAPFDPGVHSSSLERRRLMEELEYGDSGKWPVGPDGSGFTLVKIDPKGGSKPSNWAWSLAVNGSPGTVNFSPGAAWDATLPKIAFNEVSGASDAVFQIELFNHGATTATLTGWQIIDGDTGATYTFPTTTLAAGAFLVVSEASLGFRPLDNARLFLRAGAQLADAVKVAGTPRARETAGTGRWLRPSAATFGTSNTFNLSDAIVIHEIFYEAFDGSPEEWVELKNRGSVSVDLGGWQFTDGISYTFPVGTTLAPGELLVVSNGAAALLAKYPGRRVLGDFTGNLGSGDTLRLEDAAGNPADEVSYEDSGRWTPYADGGGASLELRDARNDNASPEAWGASATAQLGAWQTIDYTVTATDDGIGNDAFRDFLLGLLDAGEVLIDDVSVRENPAGTNVEFIQNGTFQADVVGGPAASWRALGNHGIHGRTVVVVDPDNAANRCLRVVATGTTEDKSNRIETTFASGRQVTVGNSYRIRLRARWLAGSNQVNTRLYFNYAQRTTLLGVGNQWGTPGLSNSTAVPNAGPTVQDLNHTPVVPAAAVGVTVSATVSDPDGVATVQLFYRVNAGAWTSVPMTAGASGRFSGTVPGQAAGSLVQFYVRAVDSPGEAATLPAAGVKGGAFYRVSDGNTDTSGLRGNLRVLISPENEALLFTNTNRMSNDRMPATVIEDERLVYYEAGMRLKGSAFGRYAATEFGYNLDFDPTKPFRGVHTSVSIERAGNMKEIVAKHLMNRAGGGYWSQYDDVAKVIGPGVNGISLVAASRTTGVFLRSLFPGESSGTLFNHELLYQPNGTTDGGAESLKLNNPYNHTRGTYDLADRGLDKEAYRWGWQIRSQRKRDDYRSIVRLNRAFALTGTAFTSEIEATLDVDQWMRTWALMGLYGNDDQYGRLFAHNWRLYARPTDDRLIALPWDLDRAFNLAGTSALTPTAFAIQNLFAVPIYRRAFDSHVLDLVNTTFNSTYMNPWITHLGTVTGETAEFSGLSGYIETRSNFALTQLPAVVPFAITTNGGASFTTAANVAAIEGTGWVDVYTISRNGQPVPLAVTWLNSTTWRVTIPLVAGANAIQLDARDQRGTLTGSDSIVVTSNTANVAASSATLGISELHYHPAAPTPAENPAGLFETDDFQFVELVNRGAASIELAGCAFTAGINYAFTTSKVLPPGGSLVLAKNAEAFSARYGFAPAGEFTSSLAREGEIITLLSAAGAVITSFAYDDDDPWPASADGDGYSLQLIRPKTGPDPAFPIHWTSSATSGGSPGLIEDLTYVAWLAANPSVTLTGPLDDGDLDGLNNLLEYALGTDPLTDSALFSPRAAIEPLTVNGVAAEYFVFQFRRRIGAVSATWQPVGITDLITENPLGLVHLRSRNNGDGTETVAFRGNSPAGTKAFGSLIVTQDP